jgi:hypothetical protein
VNLPKSDARTDNGASTFDGALDDLDDVKGTIAAYVECECHTPYSCPKHKALAALRRVEALLDDYCAAIAFVNAERTAGR